MHLSFIHNGDLVENRLAILRSGRSLHIYDFVQVAESVDEFYSSQMRIGIDLDNTLICYDDLFVEGARRFNLIKDDKAVDRKAVREKVRSQKNGEQLWQRLQASVYSEWLDSAFLYPGAYRFLWRCRIRGIHVEAISHKTQFGNNDDPAFPLREACIRFLSELRLLSSPIGPLLQAIEFCSTRDMKLWCIAAKKLDWFIDDLPCIVDSSEISDATGMIGFDPHNTEHFEKGTQVSSWFEIENRFIGPWTENDLMVLAQYVCNLHVGEAEWIGTFGNSTVGKVRTESRTHLAVKLYSEIGTHPRLLSESIGIQVLRDHGVSNIPKQVGFSKELNVGIYQWIDGQPVESIQPSDMISLLTFVGELKKISEDGIVVGAHLPMASAAIASAADLEQQIWNRLDILCRYIPKNCIARTFMMDEFLPIARKVVRWTRHNWHGHYEYTEKISDHEKVLSPSDFGFHNALRSPGGGIIFLDFEYFGWDDPAKLIGDVCLHPGMDLNRNLRETWTQGVATIFGKDSVDRAVRIGPLLSVCWCLILLNRFRADNRNGRLSISPTPNRASNNEDCRHLADVRSRLQRLTICYKNFTY